MDYVNFYYTNSGGKTPDDESMIRITQNTIDYLIACNFSKQEIICALLKCNCVDALTIEDLPDYLWNESLIKRGCFYYHNTLQITSSPPQYNAVLKKEIVEPYFLEIKIRYTMEDLIHYFYTTLHVDRELIDYKRDAARFDALLNKYSRFGFIESLDFVLSLIDYAKHSHSKVFSIFDISANEAEVFDAAKRKTAEARFYGKNKIVCRQ